VAAALRGEGPPPVDPDDAVATLEVLEAARAASVERRVVEV
jgi:scyllo-inositol 2-dehydrogenase (NADP+)